MEESQKSPQRLASAFGFMCGLAVAAALLTPIQTPDYQRGHLAGYVDGMDDAKRQGNDEYQSGFEDGSRSPTK